jgi:hypothetical protein
MSDTNKQNGIFVPCDPQFISDGYHTFEELYRHRNLLFLAMVAQNRDKAWLSRVHEDGTQFPGYFVMGIQLPTGTVTYHLPEELWELAARLKPEIRLRAPVWDGHTSEDVSLRLHKWLAAEAKMIPPIDPLDIEFEDVELGVPQCDIEDGDCEACQ